jgi:hypothetical protein
VAVEINDLRVTLSNRRKWKNKKIGVLAEGNKDSSSQ